MVALVSVFTHDTTLSPSPSPTPTVRGTPLPKLTPPATPLPILTPTPGTSGTSGASGISLLKLATSSGSEWFLIALGVIVIYLFALWSASFVLKVVTWVLRRIRVNPGEYFYYEMDLHMEAPMKSAAGIDLLEGRVPRQIRERKADGKVKEEGKEEGYDYRALAVLSPAWVIGRGLVFWSAIRAFPRRIQTWWLFGGFERNSYRVERLTKSESLHKLYVEFDMRLGRYRFTIPQAHTAGAGLSDPLRQAGRTPNISFRMCA